MLKEINNYKLIHDLKKVWKIHDDSGADPENFQGSGQYMNTACHSIAASHMLF